MSTDLMKREIIAVMKYRDPLPSGDYYIGCIASAHVAHLLEVPYDMDLDIEEVCNSIKNYQTNDMFTEEIQYIF